jgi:hypothetical protein
MFIRRRSLSIAALIALSASFLASCGGGGSPAAAPAGLAVKATESAATVTWNMVEGVEYWLFYGPTSSAPTTVDAMSNWVGLAGGGAPMKVGSPYVVSSLTNGTSYSFSVNGRTNGGPGGPGATPVTATPTLAGSTWTVGTPAGSSTLKALTYGGSFVAAGANGAIYSSTDGSNWTASTFANTTNWNGASYFSTYKLVGDGGAVLTSPDAITWTRQNSGSTQNLHAIATNGTNLNVAVGANGTILTSTDAVGWTAVNSGTTRALYGVGYSSFNNGLWIAVGEAGTLLTSPDAVTWTAQNSGTASDLRDVVLGTNATTATATFVAVGTGATILSSTDAVAWTSRATPALVDVRSVDYGTQFIAVGAGGNIFKSTDGATWTNSPVAGSTADLYSVIRSSLAYFAVGAAGANLIAR